VVAARLSDASFFWKQDRARPLAQRAPELDAVTFQAKLGSLGDKVRRLRVLTGALVQQTSEEARIADRAAELSKCDLLTAMVGEFPELQGIMGCHYALADGEPEAVAEAIREHYLPRGAGDDLPATRPGMLLAIADKLDTLCGIFAINEQPTGAKDPFGVRRAAIGLLRIVIERRLDLDLRTLIERSAAAYSQADAATATGVYSYVMERLRAYYLEGQAAAADAPALTTEMFDAVLVLQPRSPLDFDARLRALASFMQLPEASSLTAANKRIANILRKAGEAAPADVDPAALREPAEVRLYDALRALQDSVRASTARREYAAGLGQLAQLRPALDTFFDQILVMAEDPQLRANRLALLARLHALFSNIADLSKLPG
jgi:glycyl-tRNA synthetase beta chain